MRSRKELVEYTRRYMPYEREETAAQAWEAHAQEGPEAVQSLISDFYQTADTMAEEDTRAFDIEALADDHDAVLVTAIRTYGNLGPFRPQNREDFKGVRLFDVLLRPNQIACCSTVVEGDRSDNLYGDWGVILGKGRIHQAFPYDATTSVSKGEIQSKFAPRIADIRPTEQIHQALHGRRLYNEVNAEIGGVAGIFYCIDEDDTSRHDFPSQVFRDLIEPFGIPQYLLQGGKFYRVDGLDDAVNGNFDKATLPSEIVRQSILPTDQQRNDMIDYLSNNLTLAPRNSITSGVTRGQFAYDFRRLTPNGSSDRFLREQERLVTQENESLRLYGAMALYAYAELAEQNSDTSSAEQARKLAHGVLDMESYDQYKERILPSGNLTITEDDLRSYLDTEELPTHLQDH